MSARLDAALEFASYGWQAFPVSRTTKRPVLGENWKELASSDPDDIKAAWERAKKNDPDPNVAVMMGPRSRLVDIEIDCPEELEMVKSLFGSVLDYCPQYRSLRGTHYLFRWTHELERLPQKPFLPWKGKNYGPFRFDNHYSVFPPSFHAKGGLHYRWVDGYSPDLVPPPDIPVEIIDEIAGMLATKGVSGGSKLWKDIRTDSVREGARHDTMVSVVGKMLHAMGNITPETVELTLLVASVINETKMAGGGLPDSEVAKIVTSLADKEACEREKCSFVIDESAVQQEADEEQIREEIKDRRIGDTGRLRLFGEDARAQIVRGQPAYVVLHSEKFKNSGGKMIMRADEFVDARLANKAFINASLKPLTAQEKSNWLKICNRVFDVAEEIDGDYGEMNRETGCILAVVDLLLAGNQTLDKNSPAFKHGGAPTETPWTDQETGWIIFQRRAISRKLQAMPERWKPVEATAALNDVIKRSVTNPRFRASSRGHKLEFTAVDPSKLWDIREEACDGEPELSVQLPST